MDYVHKAQVYLSSASDWFTDVILQQQKYTVFYTFL